MKALTIRQPWAHAIIRDGKDVENRTWAPPIAAMPFRMAVHAGKGYDGPGAYRGEPDRDGLVFGAVIGEVTFDGVHHADECECMAHRRLDTWPCHETVRVLALIREVRADECLTTHSGMMTE